MSAFQIANRWPKISLAKFQIRDIVRMLKKAKKQVIQRPIRPD